jgi:hypothetical protein
MQLCSVSSVDDPPPYTRVLEHTRTCGGPPYGLLLLLLLFDTTVLACLVASPTHPIKAGVGSSTKVPRGPLGMSPCTA